MRIINDKLLRSYRDRACEVCGSTYGTVFHHVYQRSAGRMDVDCNGVALCFYHHADHHAGQQPDKLACLRIIARRHRVTVAKLVAVLNTLRAADKFADAAMILEALNRGKQVRRGAGHVDRAGRKGTDGLPRRTTPGDASDSGKGVAASQGFWAQLRHHG